MMPKQIFEKEDERWLRSEAPLWRYVSLRTLFLYLSGSVFIPSVAKLQEGDPFEGEFYEETSWFNDAFDKRYGKKAEQLEKWILKKLCSESDRQHIKINKHYPNAAADIFRRRYFDFIRKTRFAWCWFHSYRESAAMWHVYGNQGVAIQTTVQRLREALKTTRRKFVFGRMTYVDYQTGPSVEFNPESQSDYHLLLRPYFLKRMEYKSEDEVRFVTVGPRETFAQWSDVEEFCSSTLDLGDPPLAENHSG